MGASPHTPIKIARCKSLNFSLIYEIMIPDYQSLMLPILEVCSNRTISIKEATTTLADKYGLSNEERAQLIPSGQQTTLFNRVSWAKTYLKKAGLIEYPERGKFVITEAGKKVLQSKPNHINIKFLKQFESFQDFRAGKGTQSDQTDSLETDDTEAKTDDATPDENLRSAYETIRNALADDLLDRVRNAPPQFFEQLIVELLVSMRYGGTTPDAGRRLGGSGDDGVDGVIDQDPLGVDQVYVQAKRYKEGNNIGSTVIREFSGAIQQKNAQKGIFFTTSAFTKEAQKAVSEIGVPRIVLIDGKRLSNLMIDYNIGCREEEIIKLKKIDEDFFDPE